MEIFEERAKKRSEERKRLKRKRDEDAHHLHEEVTYEQMDRAISMVEKTLDAVIIPTSELNLTAVEMLRKYFTVVPHYSENDDEFHSFWRVD